MFYVHPYLGKISNLTSIFQMGWNHQLGHCLMIPLKKFHNESKTLNWTRLAGIFPFIFPNQKNNRWLSGILTSRPVVSKMFNFAPRANDLINLKNIFSNGLKLPTRLHWTLERLSEGPENPLHKKIRSSDDHVTVHTWPLGAESCELHRATVDGSRILCLAYELFFEKLPTSTAFFWVGFFEAINSTSPPQVKLDRKWGEVWD